MDYGPDTYGESFADVYDDWYDDVSDVDETVDGIVALAGDGKVLELGVGTGRIAIGVARRSIPIDGIDASPSMLAKLLAKPGGELVECTLADMAELPLTGPYSLVFAAFNTFFNLTTPEAQLRCATRVHQLLSPGGLLAIEAFVPVQDRGTGLQTHRSERIDQHGSVISTVSTHDPAHQTVVGTHTHPGHEGERLALPWKIRYLTPAQIDELCTEAGFVRTARWANWVGEAFDDETSVRHVSVYTRAARVLRRIDTWATSESAP